MAKKHEDIELEIEETQEKPLRDDIEEQEAAVETEEQEEQEEQEEAGPEEDAALSAREQRKATIRALQDDTGSERVNISLRTILGGDLLAGKWFRRQIWLIVLIAFYIIVYVSNRYACQPEMLESTRLADTLLDRRYKALTSSSQLKEMTRRSKVEENLEDSTLHTPTEPLYNLKIEEE